MKSLLPPELQAKWDVRDTVPRRDRLRELAFAGYRIPRCGLFKDMSRLGVPLVVYTDELAHCGEGKVLWKPGQESPGGWWFCSEYVPDNSCLVALATNQTVSHRKLVVGMMVFHLRYTSDSWMSNMNGDCRVDSHTTHPVSRDNDLLPYPMYAVDYTRQESECDVTLTHFDLNTCPFVPLEVVNMVGRDLLTASVADFCRERGLL